MKKVTESFLNECKKQGLKILDQDSMFGKDIISLRFGLDNTKLLVRVFFDDETTAAIRGYDYVKVAEDKQAEALLCCNEMNKKMRWVKFVLDDEEISVEDDAVIEENTAGAEILELIIRMCNIADEAYPVFMEAFKD